ncbi:hypothetical protein [Streptomyces sp. MZ04]|uniref:hypothetical protein n=1 Tax=Streptomyces sp. MZ04 TaxID=2559236 RepID=UPI00107E797E|nr:hypothetical protein [Streptomyces sp. MZ04]TGA90718.1 hypothetical protein E2651_38395 [Streptomyces sp. MZ04]
MDAELTALAAAGATALVQQMVTDGWGQVRDRVAGFFSRGRDGEEDVVAGELEEARAELAAARDSSDAEAEADVLAEWRGRMRRTLRADPAAAAELRSLLEELSPGSGGERRGDVYNNFSGNVEHGVVIQSGSIGEVRKG